MGKQGSFTVNTSVPFHTPEASRTEEGGRALNKFDRATADMALSGIQTMSALLMQREVDTECEGSSLLVLSAPVACGLLDAIASCAALVGDTLDRGGRV